MNYFLPVHMGAPDNNKNYSKNSKISNNKNNNINSNINNNNSVLQQRKLAKLLIKDRIEITAKIKSSLQPFAIFIFKKIKGPNWLKFLIIFVLCLTLIYYSIPNILFIYSIISLHQAKIIF